MHFIQCLFICCELHVLNIEYILVQIEMAGNHSTHQDLFDDPPISLCHGHSCLLASIILCDPSTDRDIEDVT